MVVTNDREKWVVAGFGAAFLLLWMAGMYLSYRVSADQDVEATRDRAELHEMTGKLEEAVNRAASERDALGKSIANIELNREVLLRIESKVDRLLAPRISESAP